VAILVVGGSTKDIGKTALVCAIISELRGFDWTAVKITAHDYIADVVDRASAYPAIREETIAGQLTDTSRYLAAGARRALLVTRSGAEVPVEEIRRAVGADRNVIYESNRIVDVIKPDVCLALMTEDGETKASFERLLRVADAVVSVGGLAAEVPMESRRFRLNSSDQLSPEMMKWLRERLSI
jgi:hypothetical protein